MEKIRIQAKTLGEAITEASIQLGVPSDSMGYDLIQQSTNGFLGIGAKPCIIEAWMKAEEEPAPQLVKETAEAFVKAIDHTAEESKPAAKENKNAAVSPVNEEKKEPRKNTDKKRQDRPEKPEKAEKAEKPERQEKRQDKPERNNEKKSDRSRNHRRDSVKEMSKAESGASEKAEKPERKFEKVNGDPKGRAEEFLTSLFASMEMKINCEASFDDTCNELYINLSGEDMGVLIGKRGQTLDALQYLTSQVVNKHLNTYVRVKMDTENYRERRRETLEALAENIAVKVRRTHRPVALEPMNPYERRIIHSVLQAEKEVMTRSEGEEPYRHVVVCPVKKKRYGSKVNLKDAVKETVEEEAVTAEKIPAEAAEPVTELVESFVEEEISVKAESLEEAAFSAAEEIAAEEVPAAAEISSAEETSAPEENTSI